MREWIESWPEPWRRLVLIAIERSERIRAVLFDSPRRIRGRWASSRRTDWSRDGGLLPTPIRWTRLGLWAETRPACEMCLVCLPVCVSACGYAC